MAEVAAVRAFSLVELLVVIVIIAVLAFMLLPVIGIVRDRAKLVACMGNVRQLNLGLLAYLEGGEGLLPTSFGGGTYVALSDWDHQRYGLGLLVGDYVDNHRAFFCPGLAFDGKDVRGGGEPIRALSMLSLRKLGTGSDPATLGPARADYSLGWYNYGNPATGGTSLGIGYGYARTMAGLGWTHGPLQYWIADSCDTFPWYYGKLPHLRALAMPMGRIDGGVKCLSRYNQWPVPNGASWGYYWPYNERPDWAMWEWVGTGHAIDD